MMLTTQEQKEATKFQRISVEIVAALKMLNTKIECDIEAIEGASSKIHFLRALRGTVFGEPHIIWCPEKKHYTDIIVCNHICPVPCSAFKSSKNICKMFRCPEDKIYMCEETGQRCDAFLAYSQFSERYIAAYRPLYKIREQLQELTKIKIPDKKKKTRKRK